MRAVLVFCEGYADVVFAQRRSIRPSWLPVV